jgi:hypothetical protein
MSIGDTAGGGQPPPLNSYAAHNLILPSPYKDGMINGCGGFSISPCGAPNLVPPYGFPNGYKNIAKHIYIYTHTHN